MTSIPAPRSEHVAPEGDHTPHADCPTWCREHMIDENDPTVEVTHLSAEHSVVTHELGTTGGRGRRGRRMAVRAAFTDGKYEVWVSIGDTLEMFALTPGDWDAVRTVAA